MARSCLQSNIELVEMLQCAKIDIPYDNLPNIHINIMPIDPVLDTESDYINTIIDENGHSLNITKSQLANLKKDKTFSIYSKTYPNKKYTWASRKYVATGKNKIKNDFTSSMSNAVHHINKISMSDLTESLSSIKTGLNKMVDCVIGTKNYVDVYTNGTKDCVIGTKNYADIHVNTTKDYVPTYTQSVLNDLVKSRLDEIPHDQPVYTYDDYQTIANQIMLLTPNSTKLVEYDAAIDLLNRSDLSDTARNKFTDLLNNMHIVHHAHISYIEDMTAATNEHINKIKSRRKFLSMDKKWIESKRLKFIHKWTTEHPKSEYIYNSCIDRLVGQELMIAQLYNQALKSPDYIYECLHTKLTKPAITKNIYSILWSSDKWKLEYDNEKIKYEYNKYVRHVVCSDKIGWKTKLLCTKIKHSINNTVYDRWCKIVWSAYGLRSVYGKNEYTSDLYLDYDQIKPMRKSTIWLKLSEKWSELVELYQISNHKWKPTIVERTHLNILAKFLKIIGCTAAHLFLTSATVGTSSCLLITSPIYVTLYHMIKYLVSILLWSVGQPFPLASTCIKWFIIRSLGKMIKFVTVNAYHLISVPVISVCAASKYALATIYDGLVFKFGKKTGMLSKIPSESNLFLKKLPDTMTYYIASYDIAVDVLVWGLHQLLIDWYQYVNLQIVTNIKNCTSDPNILNLVDNFESLVIDNVELRRSLVSINFDPTSKFISMMTPDLKMLETTLYTICTDYYDKYIDSIDTYGLDINIWQMLNITPYNWKEFASGIFHKVFGTNIMFAIDSISDDFTSINLVTDTNISLYKELCMNTDEPCENNIMEWDNMHLINFADLKSSMYIDMTIS